MRRSGSVRRVDPDVAIVHWARRSGCWVLLGILSGCCGSPSGTVQGRVTLDGSPLSQGMVLFHPAGDAIATTAAGRLVEGGQYSLRVPGGGDAIPTRAYQVTIHAGDGDESDPAPTTIPTNYQSATTSGLSANVVPGNNTINFNLQSNSSLNP